MYDGYGGDRPLFCEASILEVLRAHEQEADKMVASVNGNQLLNTPTEDFVDQVLEKYLFDVPVLQLDREYVEGPVETQTTVSDYGQRIVIPSTTVTFIIPFAGDADFFKIQPQSFDSMPPRAKISRGTIRIEVTQRAPNREELLNERKRTVESIEKYLSWQRKSADELKGRLPQRVRQAVEQRKAKLLEAQNLVAGLGFPMASRSSAPKTYVAPVTRKQVYTPPPPASAPYKPEPVLDENNYQAVLGIIENMTHVMERSPTAFANMGEEDIRQHFLVQLNGQFQGKATGEAFNFQGKTDILIRENDRNIFIAECKIWRGDKTFTETVDQILGYLSWRDTKAAILVFNRNKDFSSVLQKIKDGMEAHPHKKRGPTVQGETRFRYIMGSPSDHNREIILTVMAFEIPSKGEV